MAFFNTGLACSFTAASAGTANFVVSAAFGGKLTPEQAGVATGKVYTYYAQSLDGTVWERGSGAYDSTTHTLARTTIAATSNDNQLPVNFAVAPIVDVYPASLAKLEPIAPILGGVDFNTVILLGSYYCVATTNTNTPVASAQWYLEVIIHGTNSQYLMQRATRLDAADATIYTRILLANVWQAWRIQVNRPNAPVAANQFFAGPASGAAADPAFRGLVGLESALVLLGTATAASSANISFTGLAGANYSEYILVISNLLAASNSVDLNLQISTGAGFITGAVYNYGTWFWDSGASAVTTNNSATQATLTASNDSLGNSATSLVSGEVHIPGADSTVAHHQLMWTLSGLLAGAPTFCKTIEGSCVVDTAAAVIDGIKIFCSSGNIASGKFRLYGLRNS